MSGHLFYRASQWSLPGKSQRSSAESRVAALYYLAAALVVAICRAVPPLWDGVFIFLVFLPSVLLIGSLWGATTLVRFRRPSAWGALAVHAVAVPLIWWFTVPKVG